MSSYLLQNFCKKIPFIVFLNFSYLIYILNYKLNCIYNIFNSNLYDLLWYLSFLNIFRLRFKRFFLFKKDDWKIFLSTLFIIPQQFLLLTFLEGKYLKFIYIFISHIDPFFVFPTRMSLELQNDFVNDFPYNFVQNIAVLLYLLLIQH